MVAFMKKRTSKTVREETARMVEFPTTTICFHTATKLSISKKYGFKANSNKYSQNVANQTLATTFDSLSFQLDEDFFIQDSMSGRMLQIGTNYMISEDLPWEGSPGTFTFEFNPVRTYSSGTCYKLQPKFYDPRIPLRFKIKIILSPTLIGVINQK